MKACGLDKPCGGRICFPAAPAAAGAETAIVCNDGMPHFSSGKIGTGIHFTVQNDAASYACSQSNSYGVLSSPKSARLIFSIGRGIRVVLYDDVLLKAVRQEPLQGKILQIQVIGVFHHTGLPVDSAGAADPDPRDIVQRKSGLSQSFQTGLCQILDELQQLTGDFRFPV